MERICDEALKAISDAVDEEHSVFCLEQLGVSTRLLNLLHGNGIRTIGDLMNTPPGRVMGLQNLGEGQFRMIMSALAKYHTIEDI